MKITDNRKCIHDEELYDIAILFGLANDHNKYVAYRRSVTGGNVVLEVVLRNGCALTTVYTPDHIDKFCTRDVIALINYMSTQLSRFYTFEDNYIQCAKTTRDMTSSMVRAKSSNIWSYAFDIKDNKSRFGRMYIQFKNSKGGPGDIYEYFDVPSVMYRRFVSAPSKGHFFWVYIRNIYKYRKLTGNKRGVLRNAIN